MNELLASVFYNEFDVMFHVEPSGDNTTEASGLSLARRRGIDYNQVHQGATALGLLGGALADER